MDKEKMRRYEVAVYLFLGTLALVFGFAGDRIANDSLKSVTLNLSSEFLAVAILFFIINRFFLMGDDGYAAHKVLEEVTALRNELHEEIQERQKRQAQKVKVILNHGAKRLELPVELRRAEFSRAEVLGRIGMIPLRVKGARFSLRYTNTPDFLDQINQISARDGDAILTIPCDESEMTQFELNDQTP